MIFIIVIGGMLFGHERPGVFRAEHERVVETLAAQAAVGLNKASLYQDAVFARRRADVVVGVVDVVVRDVVGVVVCVEVVGTATGSSSPPVAVSSQTTSAATRASANSTAAIIHGVDPPPSPSSPPSRWSRRARAPGTPP